MSEDYWWQQRVDDYVFASTHCRKCGRYITENSSGKWIDQTRDPAYCPSAIDFLHAPSITTAPAAS